MRRAVYVGYRTLAGVFVLGVLVQFFLAGLGVFESESIFETHGTFGTILGALALLLLILAGGLAMSGELDRAGVGTAGLLVGLMILQYALVELFTDGAPVLAALHPVNGLLVLGIGVLVASGRNVALPARPTHLTRS